MSALAEQFAARRDFAIGLATVTQLSALALFEQGHGAGAFVGEPDLTPVNRSKTHRALDDIRCHLEEARTFRDYF